MSYIQKRGQNTAWRTALMRNLASELIIHEKLEITKTRAKELRKHVEKLITLAKKQNLHARRQAAAVLRNIKDEKIQKTALDKLFSTLALRYKKRNGGYIRILNIGNRQGDNSPLVIIELIK